MKKLLLIIVLVLVPVVLYSQWDRLRNLVGGEDEVAAEELPTPELAEQADLKLASLKNGEAERVAFHALELQSLLKYRYVQLLPAFVDSPQVKLGEGKLQLTARLPVDRLPSISEIGEAASFLPDTAEVGMTGSLLPLDSGRVALSIHQVRAARIPLPGRLVPKALERLGRRPEPGLPANALALPLPGGVSNAEVKGDSLILYARPHRRIE